MFITVGSRSWAFLEGAGAVKKKCRKREEEIEPLNLFRGSRERSLLEEFGAGKKI